MKQFFHITAYIHCLYTPFSHSKRPISSHDQSDSGTIHKIRFPEVAEHRADVMLFNQAIGFSSYFFRIVVIHFMRKKNGQAIFLYLIIHMIPLSCTSPEGFYYTGISFPRKHEKRICVFSHILYLSYLTIFYSSSFAFCASKAACAEVAISVSL